jgi:hypothetical protein
MGLAGAGNMSFITAGGGSGGYSRKYATAADIGASKAVTIGAGGTGGGYNVGGNVGGATSVGTLCVANGGGGGSWIGGYGGVPGTGDIAAAGSPGGIGSNISTNSTTYAYVSAGQGGSSFFGGGATGLQWAPNGNYQAPYNGSNYGGGGGGASINNSGAGLAGGNGSAGVVIITEYA